MKFIKLIFLSVILLAACNSSDDDTTDIEETMDTETSIEDIKALLNYNEGEVFSKALFTIIDSELKIDFGNGFISGPAEKNITYKATEEDKQNGVQDEFTIIFTISNTSTNFSRFNGLSGEIEFGRLEILDGSSQVVFNGSITESKDEADLTKSRIVVNILDNCRATVTVNGSSFSAVGGPIYMLENEDLSNLLVQAEVYEDFESAQDNVRCGGSSFKLQSGRDIVFSSCNSASFFVTKGNTYSINILFDDGLSQSQTVSVDKAGITHFISIVQPRGTGLGLSCLPDGKQEKITLNTLKITSTEGVLAAEEELHIHPGFFSKVSEGSTIIVGPFNGKLAGLSFFRIKNENGALENKEYDLSKNELTVHRDFQYDATPQIRMTAIDGKITISESNGETNIFFDNVVFENNLTFAGQNKVTITGILKGVL